MATGMQSNMPTPLLPPAWDIDEVKLMRKYVKSNPNMVEVRGLHSELLTSAEFVLPLFFENEKKCGGGEIQKLYVSDENQAAVILFKHTHVAERLVNARYMYFYKCCLTVSRLTFHMWKVTKCAVVLSDTPNTMSEGALKSYLSNHFQSIKYETGASPTVTDIMVDFDAKTAHVIFEDFIDALHIVKNSCRLKDGISFAVIKGAVHKIRPMIIKKKRVEAQWLSIKKIRHAIQELGLDITVREKEQHYELEGEKVDILAKLILKKKKADLEDIAGAVGGWCSEESRSPYTEPGASSHVESEDPGTPVKMDEPERPLDCNGDAGMLRQNATIANSMAYSDDDCAICCDKISDPKKLDKCGHIYCRKCIDMAFEKCGRKCPLCGAIYGEVIGNQPSNGTMHYSTDWSRLPGYPHCGTITIDYNFPSGIQDKSHPNPGAHYSGTSRRAYLPDNGEGRHVLKLLQRAFIARLVFTIGQSVTTGQSNTVIWNNIHHKTQIYGGPQGFGYPDPTYLTRVKEELAAFGIK